MSLSFKLQVFEGPLDLLLHLIDKNKINIYDIPIALITDQYLDYVRQMREEDLNTASEFLVMAATLLDIKSRMLLPREEKEEEAEEEGDPRQELVERLLEYKMVRYLSDELRDRSLTASRAVFAGPRIPEEVRAYEPPLDYGVLLKGASLEGLQQVLSDVLRRQKLRVDPVRSGFGRIEKEEYDVTGRERYVRRRILEKGSVSFRALLEEQPGREEIVVTFLVILDMAKSGDIMILQEDTFGEIMLVSNGFAMDEEEETAVPVRPLRAGVAQAALPARARIIIPLAPSAEEEPDSSGLTGPVDTLPEDTEPDDLPLQEEIRPDWEELWNQQEDRRPWRPSSLPWAKRWRSQGCPQLWKSRRRKSSRRSRNWKNDTRRPGAACRSIAMTMRSSCPQEVNTTNI